MCRPRRSCCICLLRKGVWERGCNAAPRPRESAFVGRMSNHVGVIYCRGRFFLGWGTNRTVVSGVLCTTAKQASKQAANEAPLYFRHGIAR